MAVATMLREPPIYDALKERTLALWRSANARKYRDYSGDRRN
jgi:hypothetical protein